MEDHAHKLQDRGPDRRQGERRQGSRRLDDMIASSFALSEFQEIEREYRQKQALKHALLWQDYMEHERKEARKAQMVAFLVVLAAFLFVAGFAFAVAKFVGVLP